MVQKIIFVDVAIRLISYPARVQRLLGGLLTRRISENRLAPRVFSEPHVKDDHVRGGSGICVG